MWGDFLFFFDGVFCVIDVVGDFEVVIFLVEVVVYVVVDDVCVDVVLVVVI